MVARVRVPFSLLAISCTTLILVSLVGCQPILNHPVAPTVFTFEPQNGNQNPETVLPSPREPGGRYKLWAMGSMESQGASLEWTFGPKTTASSDWLQGQVRRPPVGHQEGSRWKFMGESQIEDNRLDHGL